MVSSDRRCVADPSRSLNHGMGSPAARRDQPQLWSQFVRQRWAL